MGFSSQVYGFGTPLYTLPPLSDHDLSRHLSKFLFAEIKIRCNLKGYNRFHISGDHLLKNSRLVCTCLDAVCMKNFDTQRSSIDPLRKNS